MNRRQLLAAAGMAMVARGQEFEVASIKPSAPMTGMGMRIGVQIAPGGRLMTTGTPVKFLIQQAYGVRDFQIIGGPAWIGTDRYDITAKADGPATNADIKPMLQKLLADRFKLSFHRETKELPTYALVVGKGGAKLHASEAGGDGKPGMMRMGRGQFTADGVPITALANQLAQVLGRSVIDKTELQGNYDVKLQWTPDESQAMFRTPEHPDAPPAETSGPSLFTALQEQLGLKLESTKGPVETLIIDRVEKASEN